MPMICESPREYSVLGVQSQLFKTRVEAYALEIAEVARERGLDAEWGRDGCEYDPRNGLPKGGYRFYAEVFDVSQNEFSEILQAAQGRIAP